MVKEFGICLEGIITGSACPEECRIGSSGGICRSPTDVGRKSKILNVAGKPLRDLAAPFASPVSSPCSRGPLGSFSLETGVPGCFLLLSHPSTANLYLLLISQLS